MEHRYNGYIDINGTQYAYTFSDFLLSIHIGERHDKYVGWDCCNQVIKNGWIHIWDLTQNELYLRVDSPIYLSPGEFGYNISGYIRLFYLDRKSNRDSEFACQTIVFRHPVIDFLFDCDDAYIQRLIFLLKKWRKEVDVEDISSDRHTHNFSANGIDYSVSFPTFCSYEYANPFPFDIFNAINVVASKPQSIDDVWRISNIIKLFLQLVSQSGTINLDKVKLDPCSINSKYNACLYLRTEKNIPLPIRDRVLKYRDIQESIGNLLNQICNNQVYFRALFSSDNSKIYTHDIMNICAAFESQFAALEPKFKDKALTDVKRKMVNDLASHRKEYSEDEFNLFDTILMGLKNFNDTLQTRLQIALDEFIRIYGADNVEFDFSREYATMPKRIKDTRNALDHGNRTYSLNALMFRDTELLRAITYMLILKKADMPDSNIKACLQKLAKIPH